MNRDDGVDGGGRAGENGGCRGVIFFCHGVFFVDFSAGNSSDTCRLCASMNQDMNLTRDFRI